MGLLQTVDEAAFLRSQGTPTPPGVTATVNGHAVDLAQWVGSNSPTSFRALFTADQTGTLFIQHSQDGLTWITDNVATIATIANKVVNVQANIAMRFVRASFTNGATACTTWQFSSALVG